MEIGALPESYRVKLPQPDNPVLFPLPFRLMALGPSSSGKTNALVTMLTDKRFYRDKFSKIYWVSPTATVDGGLDQLRAYMETHDQNQEEDPTFHDGLGDEVIDFLEGVVARAKRVMQFMKESKMQQKGFNTLLVLDDLADARARPRLQKFIDGCAVKNRHFGISFILATQKLRLPLISPTVRVNLSALMVWRLRNQHDLWDGLVHEYSALIDKDKLYAAYKAATDQPYGFLSINLLAQDKDQTFLNGFNAFFKMSD